MDSGGYHRDPASLSLAPSCEEMLRMRGVSGIRPLRCQRSDSGLEVLAETSIFETSNPRAEPGPPGAHIRITLTLKYVECERRARWDAPENTNVRFSITTGFLHVPPSPGRDGEDLEKARTICDVCNSRGPCAIKERPSKDDSDVERTLMITDTVRLPERKAAEAEFLLPSSMESG